MSASYQGSLFDPVSVHGGEPSLGRLRGFLERHELGDAAWVDVRRNWVAGADDVFATLARRVPWQPYDGAARLVHTYAAGEGLPHRLLRSARQALANHYAPEAAGAFAEVRCCYDRDGRDALTWRTEEAEEADDVDPPLLAVLVLGDPRRLVLRPRRGGASVAFSLGHGDLVVLGGSDLGAWLHVVPRVARTGSRLHVVFRAAPPVAEVDEQPAEADTDDGTGDAISVDHPLSDDSDWGA